jgi:hypothetical protein
MAKVINNSMHGKIGDVLYRTWKDVQYVTPVPKKKTASDSKAHKDNIQGFAVCCKLGAVMSRIMVLDDHWKNADVEAYMSRTKFVKFNRSRILPVGNISNVQLVSAVNLQPVNLKYYDFSVGELNCEFEIVPPDIFCKELSLQGIVQLAGPKYPAYENVMFFPFVSPNYRLTTQTALTMKAKFSSQDTELVKMYDNANVLLNLAFKDIQGKVRKFSETKYLEMNG